MSELKIVIWTGVAFSLWHIPAVTMSTEDTVPVAQVPVLLVNAVVIGAIWCHAVWNAAVYVFLASARQLAR